MMIGLKFILTLCASVIAVSSLASSQKDNDKFTKEIVRQNPDLAGVGLIISSEDDGRIVVSDIVENSPAAKSLKIQVGDVIERVSDLHTGKRTNVYKMPVEKVSELILGQAGQEVELKLKGKKEYSVVLERVFYDSIVRAQD